MTTENASPRRLLAIVLPALILAFVAAASLYAYKKIGGDKPKLDVYGSLPEFQLTDQDGAELTRADLAGKVVIANFIFTRCPTVCPTFTMTMKRIADKLRDSPITLLSFSVDPEFDQPEVLTRFAAKFGVDHKRWKFVTGDPKSIKEHVVSGLSIALQQRGTLEDGTPDIVHGTHIVLIDGKHQIRGFYNSDTPERLEQLVRDARALAR